MTVSQNWRFSPLAPASVQMSTFDRVRNSWTSASRTATSRLGREPGASRAPSSCCQRARAWCGAGVVVVAAEQRDVLVREPDVEEQLAQVLLGGDRFGEDHGLAAAAARRAPRSRITRIASWKERALASLRQGLRAGDEAPRRGPARASDGRSAVRPGARLGVLGSALGDLVLVFQIAAASPPPARRARPWPAARRRSRAATFSRLAASAGIDEAMRR